MQEQTKENLENKRQSGSVKKRNVGCLTLYHQALLIPTGSGFSSYHLHRSTNRTLLPVVIATMTCSSCTLQNQLNADEPEAAKVSTADVVVDLICEGQPEILLENATDRTLAL